MDLDTFFVLTTAGSESIRGLTIVITRYRDLHQSQSRICNPVDGSGLYMGSPNPDLQPCWWIRIICGIPGYGSATLMMDPDYLWDPLIWIWNLVYGSELYVGYPYPDLKPCWWIRIICGIPGSGSETLLMDPDYMWDTRARIWNPVDGSGLYVGSPDPDLKPLCIILIYEPRIARKDRQTKKANKFVEKLRS